MAGLLDNEFVRFMLTGPRQYYARKDQQDQQAQFQGLLGSLDQQGPPEPGQASLLGQREPDQQFWLKAAQIPAYQQLAAQQLGDYNTQQGAMQRQMQGQQYAANNMTYAQQMAEDRQRKMASLNYQLAQEDLARKNRGTDASVASAYASAANSNASRALTGARLIEQEAKNRSATSPVLYNQLKPQEKVEANDALGSMDQYAQGAIDVLDWAENRPKTGLGTGAAAAYNSQWQSTAKPAYMKILNTGVLQGKEAEQLADIIKQPDDYILTDSDMNVLRTVTKTIQDKREQTYRNYGLKANPQAVGASPASRAISESKGAKPVGKLIDWNGPEGGTIWHPVQRTR
jgi:hypothetical protein